MDAQSFGMRGQPLVARETTIDTHCLWKTSEQVLEEVLRAKRIFG